MNEQAAHVPTDDELADALAQADAEGWGDMIRGPQDRHALAEGCRFDARFADHAVRFFEQGLVHQDGRFRGQPFHLLPWQRDDIIRPLYGWRRSDGTRRYRVVTIYIAKKNGKTTLAAGMGLYSFFEPDPHTHKLPHGLQAYAASTSQQTGQTYYLEAEALARSPKIAKHLRAVASTKRIILPNRRCFLKVLAHRASSAEGLLASFVVLDEIHAMKSAQLYSALRYAGASQLQPLLVEISTVGVDTDSLWRDRFQYAQAVDRGDVVDTAQLSAIYAAPTDAELDDLDALRAANPSLGHTVPETDILRDARQAKAGTARDAAEFRRYRMNIPVGAHDAWISPDLWDEGQKPFDLADLEGRPCYAGLDLAKVADFSALVLLWPPQDAEPWLCACWLWLPRAQVDERIARGSFVYQAWEHQGLVEVTEGDTTDHHLIRRRILELAERFPIKAIGIDRNFEGWQFTQDLFNDDELPAVGVGQGWASQDVPMQTLEALVRDRRLNAGGNPAMRHHIANAVAKRTGPTGDNYHLKRTEPEAKIDAVAALINALHVSLKTPEDPGPVQYFQECPLI